MTIHDILATYGYTQTTLARHFGIPLRTVQNWYGGVNAPPGYVISMMIRILELEKRE